MHELDSVAVIWLQPGNGASFLSLVEKLTGKPLTANAWVKELQTPTQQKVGRCGTVHSFTPSSRLARTSCKSLLWIMGALASHYGPARMDMGTLD